MNPRANGALIGSTFERSGPWVQRADFEQAADTVIRSPSARPTSISRSHVKSLGIPPPRRSRSRALTWGADEKVLLALAAAGWPASRGQGKGLRRAGNHVVLAAVAAALLPHGMKRLFNQTRPDRRTVMGHVHGISFSGRREDAFRSGHALHMGALASAAGTLRTRPRWAIRAFAIGLSLTRVVVLAHWASDVVAGFALGAILERLLRLWTGYPLDSAKEDARANTGKP
jgi:membrane-associated phospholipid phosphatase